MSAGLRFEPIDGRSAYEILGTQPHATDEELKRAYKSAMMANHQNPHGSETVAKKLNVAYDFVRPHVRRDYDLWWSARAGGPRPAAKGENEIRSEILERIVAEALRLIREKIRANPSAPLAEVAKLAAWSMGENAKAFSDGVIRVHELERILTGLALRTNKIESAPDQLIPLAAGVIDILRERREEAARTALIQLEANLEMEFIASPGHARNAHFDRVYMHLTGFSYLKFSDLTEEMSIAPCEAALRYSRPRDSAAAGQNLGRYHDKRTVPPAGR